MMQSVSLKFIAHPLAVGWVVNLQCVASAVANTTAVPDDIDS